MVYISRELEAQIWRLLARTSCFYRADRRTRAALTWTSARARCTCLFSYRSHTDLRDNVFRGSKIRQPYHTAARSRRNSDVQVADEGRVGLSVSMMLVGASCVMRSLIRKRGLQDHWIHFRKSNGTIDSFSANVEEREIILKIYFLQFISDSKIVLLSLFLIILLARSMFLWLRRCVSQTFT